MPNTKRVVAFDVETPNSKNNRMSSIGLAVIEDGVIVDSLVSYIDPQVPFDDFNIGLTGIRPQDVAGAPTFDELWRSTLCELMAETVLVAHNAPFDMRVLAHCLSAYGFETPAKAVYADTVQMGRKVYPGLSNHKLDTLCDHCDIDLDHHRADSDSLACAHLLLDYTRQGARLEDFLKGYDFHKKKTFKLH